MELSEGQPPFEALHTKLRSRPLGASTRGPVSVPCGVILTLRCLDIGASSRRQQFLSSLREESLDGKRSTSQCSGQSVVLSCGAVLLHSASPLTHSDVPAEIPSQIGVMGRAYVIRNTQAAQIPGSCTDPQPTYHTQCVQRPGSDARYARLLGCSALSFHACENEPKSCLNYGTSRFRRLRTSCAKRNSFRVDPSILFFLDILSIYVLVDGA